jgi:hypothetical protein
MLVLSKDSPIPNLPTFSGSMSVLS